MEEMHQYPSDISREEYDLIREDLEGAKKTTRPRNPDDLSHVEKFLVDAGYSGERSANQVKDICGAHQRPALKKEVDDRSPTCYNRITAVDQLTERRDPHG